VDWDWTKVLEAEIASHNVTARKEKGQNKWFIGGITGDSARSVIIKFDFLPKGKTYNAIIYKDAETTEYINNPEKYEIEKVEVTSETVKTINMKAAGGFAISIME
jgi:glucan 1,4-alpha-glucosidase